MLAFLLKKGKKKEHIGQTPSIPIPNKSKGFGGRVGLGSVTKIPLALFM
jgi:hypothetical protein